MKCQIIFLILFLLSFPIYGVQLWQGTTEQDLLLFAKTAKWRSLIHQNRKAEAIVDINSAFYISSETNNSQKNTIDPYLELQKTIEAFQNPSEYVKLNRGHPYCLFPARLSLLKMELKLQVQEITCPAYLKWRNFLQFDKIAVVYTSQYITNPASVMGHIFLKLINSNTENYLNTSIGFLASVPKEINPIMYAYKGFSGQFFGSFQEGYFFEKVQEYNNIESRDLWEYEINLTSEQRNLFIDHIWELKQNSKIRYYFTNQNCATVVLSILHSVMEPLKTNNAFFAVPLYVSPLEVLKNLNSDGAIIKENYRPSSRASLLLKYKRLTWPETKQVLNSIYFKDDSPTKTSPLVADTLLDYIGLQRYKTKGRSEEKYKYLETSTMLYRSKLNSPEEFTILRPESPLQSHGLGKFSFGYGERDESYLLFEITPLSHQLLDNTIGFIKNSSLIFLNLDFAYLTKLKSIELLKLKFIEISNKPNFNMIDPQMSWGFLTEYQRYLELPNLIVNSGLLIQPTFGISLPLTNYTDLYTHLSFEEYVIFQKNTYSWFGAELGILFNLNEKYKINFKKIESKEFTGSFLKKNKLGAQIRFNNIFQKLYLDLEVTNTTFSISNINSNSQNTFDTLLKVGQEF